MGLSVIISRLKAPKTKTGLNGTFSGVLGAETLGERQLKYIWRWGIQPRLQEESQSDWILREQLDLRGQRAKGGRRTTKSSLRPSRGRTGPLR